MCVIYLSIYLLVLFCSTLVLFMTEELNENNSKGVIIYHTPWFKEKLVSHSCSFVFSCRGWRLLARGNTSRPRRKGAVHAVRVPSGGEAWTTGGGAAENYRGRRNENKGEHVSLRQ